MEPNLPDNSAPAPEPNWASRIDREVDEETWRLTLEAIDQGVTFNPSQLEKLEALAQRLGRPRPAIPDEQLIRPDEQPS